MDYSRNSFGGDDASIYKPDEHVTGSNMSRPDILPPNVVLFLKSQNKFSHKSDAKFLTCLSLTNFPLRNPSNQFLSLTSCYSLLVTKEAGSKKRKTLS
jgi:hypothetical protein